MCLLCDAQEKIPYVVVREFDRMDEGDPSVPPMFACEQCGAQMYPEYYEGIHGVVYRLADVK